MEKCVYGTIQYGFFFLELVQPQKLHLISPFSLEKTRLLQLGHLEIAILINSNRFKDFVRGIYQKTTKLAFNWLNLSFSYTFFDYQCFFTFWASPFLSNQHSPINLNLTE